MTLLPEETARFLERVNGLNVLVIGCTEPPTDTAPRNHNDLTRALAIHERLRPKHTYLTHIGHELDVWLQRHALPQGVCTAQDDMSFALWSKHYQEGEGFSALPTY